MRFSPSELSLERKILIGGFCVALVTTAIVGALQYRSVHAYFKSDRGVANSTEILHQLEAAISDMVDAESTSRGYGATGDEKSIAHLNVSISNVQEHLQALQVLSAENPGQKRDLRELASLIDRELQFVRKLTEVRRDNGVAAATELLRQSDGTRLMGEIRARQAVMEAEEANGFDVRQLANSATARDVEWAIAVGGFVMIAFVIAASLIMRRDVSNRVYVEQRYRMLAAIVESSDDAIISKNLDGMITQWNKGAEKIYGYTESKIVGKPISTIIPPDHQDELVAILSRVSRGERVPHFETVRVTKGGVRLDVSLAVSPIRDSGGRISGASSVARDITEQKRADEALRVANAHNRSLFEASLDPLVTISPDGKITDVNDATEKATGRSRAELIGTDFCDYFTEPDRARSGYQQAFHEGRVRDFELTIRRKDGHLTPIIYNASVYGYEPGAVTGLFAAARDISERKRAEEELQKLNEELERRVADRTAQLQASNQELEAFTYSVSHDLRAPLRHIDGFSKLLANKYRAELSPDAQDYIATIRESVQQMGMLIDDLLSLARVGRKQLSMEVTGLNSIADEVVAELKHAYPDRAIEWNVRTLPFVECDPNLMKQVFANLLANAVKFTRPRTPAVIEVGASGDGGSPVVFVRDNGVGFSMKYANKLFGVFQRLHRAEDFEGTGVGLATVQRIIHKHGGRVWAEAALGRGATFFFTVGDQDEAQSTIPPIQEVTRDATGSADSTR
jgi:PAS domain S-box-containing protein